MMAQVIVINAVYQFVSITLLWILCLITNNGSWIDIGWPVGFTFSAVLTLLYSPTNNISLKVICTGYIICGSRFIIGWFLRRHYKHQDRRFNLWCDLWRKQKILLLNVISTSSIPINYFLWFELQAACNMTIFYAPLYAVYSLDNNNNNNDNNYNIGNLEWFGIILWCIGIIIEHLSDVQLTNWKISHKGSNSICQHGFWFYSRHPNYFGEILIWISYSIFALHSVLYSGAYRVESFLFIILLFLSPYLMYRWLRYTAAWILEMKSVQKRPKYVKYQSTTNMIIPWFPSSNNKIM